MDFSVLWFHVNAMLAFDICLLESSFRAEKNIPETLNRKSQSACMNEFAKGSFLQAKSTEKLVRGPLNMNPLVRSLALKTFYPNYSEVGLP